MVFVAAGIVNSFRMPACKSLESNVGSMDLKNSKVLFRKQWGTAEDTIAL